MCLTKVSLFDSEAATEVQQKTLVAESLSLWQEWVWAPRQHAKAEHFRWQLHFGHASIMARKARLDFEVALAQYVALAATVVIEHRAWVAR